MQSREERDTQGVQSTGDVGWMDGGVDGEKGWAKQMVPDREALQGDLDFILGEARASCQCFHNWRAARLRFHSESHDSTLNADRVVRETLGTVVIMSALKWLAESSGGWGS